MMDLPAADRRSDSGSRSGSLSKERSDAARRILKTQPEARIQYPTPVVANGSHILLEFSVQNAHSSTITIGLSSSERSATFQLENENLTNARRSNEIGGEHNQLAHSEMFNWINLISSITLEPEESKSIIFGFTPEIDSPEDGFEPVDQQNDDLHRSTNCNGGIFLKPRLTDVENDGEDGLDRTQSTQSGGETLPLTVLKFRVPVCRSRMHISPAELKVQLDDIVIGKTYNKVLHVRNQSQIPLLFRISPTADASLSVTGDGQSVVSFAEEESGQLISTDGCTVGEFDSACVHITVKPIAVGELNYTAMVGNVFDATNAFLLHIRGFVTETQQKEVLRINAIHDFGDCYEGWDYAKFVVVENISSAPCEVDLQASHVGNVSFHIPRKEHGSDALEEIRDRKWLDESVCRQVLLKAGRSRKLVMCFKADAAFVRRHQDINDHDGPGSNSDDDSNLNDGRLQRCDFQFPIDAVDDEGTHLERRTITCRTRVCKSIIDVEQEYVDIGDVEIGTCTSHSLAVRNLSDLPAIVVVNYNSRVLSVSPAKLEIPPREVFRVAIRLTPVEIEAEYRKRITIVNKRNRTNEFVWQGCRLRTALLHRLCWVYWMRAGGARAVHATLYFFYVHSV
eukprot:m.406449 g.406449  ORF g.406449 m.406449 type:complete len:624 (-) comp21215_c0_seq4:1143-3014(-)